MDLNKYGYNGFAPKPQFNTKFYKILEKIH